MDTKYLAKTYLIDELKTKYSLLNKLRLIPSSFSVYETLTKHVYICLGRAPLYGYSSRIIAVYLHENEDAVRRLRVIDSRLFAKCKKLDNELAYLNLFLNNCTFDVDKALDLIFAEQKALFLALHRKY